MKLVVAYEAAYDYEAPVSLGPHVVRLFPRDILQVRVISSRFTTNESAEVHWRRDLFDNLVARCFYPQDESRLTYALELHVETEERNPFGFILESRALAWPVVYTAREQEFLAPYGGPSGADWPPGLVPAKATDTILVLVAINEWIHRHIVYERREEGAARSPEQTLQCGRGACRDTAVLLAAVLRSRGLAARLASGYLWESASDPAERRAESALHAWTEVYLPGAGWVALDPSNGVLVDHHYLTAAVGVAPQDIAPVAGRYFGDRTIPHQMTASLRIDRV